MSDSLETQIWMEDLTPRHVKALVRSASRPVRRILAGIFGKKTNLGKMKKSYDCSGAWLWGEEYFIRGKLNR